eukprot:6173692-Pleurochrysis_carterae.AAC.8
MKAFLKFQGKGCHRFLRSCEAVCCISMHQPSSFIFASVRTKVPIAKAALSRHGDLQPKRKHQSATERTKNCHDQSDYCENQLPSQKPCM